ncbi:shikimate dehydrogenase [Sphingomonas laterariae]|uniref:Shikimate dehydrogenase (NADP(+)) n=1 Tax=Edaphosphingomonas laterariae TaxID=861865 RepID=A0A239GRH1_9SPHN|nr:shikimate dehydrogenase [Sphingomonas laterariae]SNS71740.1 shikimate dehydrogenase [Sphingomonas laterariae]
MSLPNAVLPKAEVIGDPIAHSKSPLIHGFWLAKLGMDGLYEKTRVAGEDLGAFFADRRDRPGWRGCNVTVPHKQAVIPFLDRIDPVAARIGAVNTVVVTPEGLVGHNTDAAGFLEPLRHLLAERHLYRMARILGAGGAAKAVAHALAGHGFTLVIAARRIEQAEALAAEIDGVDTHVATLDHFADATDFAFDDRESMLDIVVNTTPLGMTGQPPLPFDFSHVPPGALIYDIVYAPLETALLAEGRARGHVGVDGLDMLIGQAAEAFRLFFGQPAPREHDAELRALLTA